MEKLLNLQSMEIGSTRMRIGICIFTTVVAAALPFSANGDEIKTHTISFDRDIRGILQKCLGCHGPDRPKADLDLTQSSIAYELAAIVPHDSSSSSLIERVSSQDPDFRMPPHEPLPDSEIKLLRQWIDEGAEWPDHWAYRKLDHPKLPRTTNSIADEECLNPIDRFIRSALAKHELEPSARADRKTLLRRLYYDLIGMPPSADVAEAFMHDERPDAYQRMVDKLLASPGYGERWARHWMDVVHFAESHGHDQDRPREHAWPYRDYLIRRLNRDVPYERFVQEQIAGDVLFPNDPWAIVATGVLAAGPWDESSLRDIQEGSIDREIGRYLDRDDIVTTVMSTFASTSVHCARCHHHKFDPVTQDTYYGLQAVFSGIDKANRKYDPDRAVAARRRSLQGRLAEISTWLRERDARLLEDRWRKPVEAFEAAHRNIDAQWAPIEWVQFTSAAGEKMSREADNSIYIEGDRPEKDTYTLLVRSRLPNIRALRLGLLHDNRLPMNGPGRNDNGNLHLNEVRLFSIDSAADPPAQRIAITDAQSDFDQGGWDVQKAIDGDPDTAWGIFPEVGKSHYAIFEFDVPKSGSTEEADRVGSPGLFRIELDQIHGGGHLIGRLEIMVTSEEGSLAIKPTLPEDITAILRKQAATRSDADWMALTAFFERQRIEGELAKLPDPAMVYCGTNQFDADGSFRPSKEPRKVHVLERGEISKPLRLAKATALSCVPGAEPDAREFDRATESERRAALAKWMSARENGLVWRSIVNRVWHYHFGQHLVDTPNDFGHAGRSPTHPELLDWLAVNLQEHDSSLKWLSRQIVTSATYQQSSRHRPKAATIDASNRMLWRMNRKRLDAESFRDSLLKVSESLDNRMGGPSDRQFNQSKGVHVTPLVDYQGFDIDDRSNYRRSVYRFIFRTLPDPFMDALDCPDASQLSPTRGESVTPIQALATMNDKLVIRQSELLSERIASEHPSSGAQTNEAFRRILGRVPTSREHLAVANYIEKHGLANACRLLVNTNEFMFVD